MTTTFSNAVSSRIEEHLAALERIGLARAVDAFVEHECLDCDGASRYVDAVEDAVRGGAVELPPRTDCLATHVGAVGRIAHLRLALTPELQRRVDAFASAFEGLVELEAAPLEAPLPAALASTRSQRPDSPQVVRLMHTPSTPTRPRHFGFIAALAAAVLAGLLAWWLLAPRPSTEVDVAADPEPGHACDSDALRRSIASVQQQYAAHPARLGDHGLGQRAALETLVGACPKLPEYLRYRLDLSLAVSADQRATTLANGLREPTEDYKALRRRVCTDDSVFDDIGMMRADERGPAVVRRCGLEGVGLGDATSSVYEHMGILGFVLYRFLLDDGIDPDLARAALLLWTRPELERTTTAQLPSSPHVGPVPDAILVRLDAKALELPGGPTLPLSGARVADAAPLAAWLQTQLDEAFVDEIGEVVVEAEATAPAAALLDVADAARSRDVATLAVLVRRSDGLVGAEQVSMLPDDRAPSHVLAWSGGRYQLTDARGAELVSAGPADAPRLLDRWAASISDHSSTILAIDVRELSVQQLVDVQVALRGRDTCDVLAAVAGMEGEAGCRWIASGMTTR